MREEKERNTFTRENIVLSRVEKAERFKFKREYNLRTSKIIVLSLTNEPLLHIRQSTYCFWAYSKHKIDLNRKNSIYNVHHRGYNGELILRRTRLKDVMGKWGTSLFVWATIDNAQGLVLVLFVQM